MTLLNPIPADLARGKITITKQGERYLAKDE
jgi:hypothetical protein